MRTPDASSLPLIPTLRPRLDIRNVQIQTHSRCNANCVYCPYIESQHHQNPGVMSDQLWEKVLRDLTPFADGINQGKVCPYLMQEPLIGKSIFDKIEQIYFVFPRTQVEISTNGAALTGRVVDRLLEVFAGRRHEVWVSHHGINAETLEHVMQINYDRAHANLINFLRTSDGRLRIKIRGAGESRDGKHRYFTRQEYLEYWRKNLCEHGIHPKNINIDAFTFHDRAGTLHRVDREAYKLNIGKIRDIGPGHEPFHCRRLDQWVHIMYDGRIRLCCMDYHGEVELPSLQDMTLAEYFESDAYRKLVGMVTGSEESPDNLICKRCVSPGG